MARRIQYPILAAIDPTTLDAPLRDELQWFIEFSVPVLRIPSVASVPTFFIDPEALGEPEAVVEITLDEYQPFSIPVLPERKGLHGWLTIDPTTLDAPLRDEIQWFNPFSIPEITTYKVRAGLFVIDPETLSEPLRDELQWFLEFSTPVLPGRKPSLGLFTIDPETLNELLGDKIEWFQEFSTPILRTQEAEPGLFVIDPATLDAPLRDELQWFSGFSLPVLPIPSVESFPAVFTDLESDIIPEVVTLDEFRPLSTPIIPLPHDVSGWYTIDPEVLSEPLRDELQWFQPFSDPIVQVRRVIEAGNIFIDEPDVVVTDESFEWFASFSEPVLPIPLRQSTEAGIIDPETLAELTRDELQWFMPFSLPVLGIPQVVEATSSIFIEGDDPPPPIPTVGQKVWRFGTVRPGGLMIRV